MATNARECDPPVSAFCSSAYFTFGSAGLERSKVSGRPAQRRGTSYQFSEAGVTIENSTGKGDFNWTAFVSTVETRSFFLLYTAIGLARVVPKRCLSSQHELETTLSLFPAHVPKSEIRHSLGLLQHHTV